MLAVAQKQHRAGRVDFTASQREATERILRLAPNPPGSPRTTARRATDRRGMRWRYATKPHRVADIGRNSHRFCPTRKSVSSTATIKSGSRAEKAVVRQ